MERRLVRLPISSLSRTHLLSTRSFARSKRRGCGERSGSRSGLRSSPLSRTRRKHRAPNVYCRRWESILNWTEKRFLDGARGGVPVPLGQREWFLRRRVRSATDGREWLSDLHGIVLCPPFGYPCRIIEQRTEAIQIGHNIAFSMGFRLCDRRECTRTGLRKISGKNERLQSWVPLVHRVRRMSEVLFPWSPGTPRCRKVVRLTSTKRWSLLGITNSVRAFQRRRSKAGGGVTTCPRGRS